MCKAFKIHVVCWVKKKYMDSMPSTSLSGLALMPYVEVVIRRVADFSAAGNWFQSFRAQRDSYMFTNSSKKCSVI